MVSIHIDVDGSIAVSRTIDEPFQKALAVV
jgi:hypothetical protein